MSAVQYLELLHASLWFTLELSWLFLIILAANQMGHFPWWKVPVSRRALGKNKTWNAYLAGPLFAVSISTLWWVIEHGLSVRLGVRSMEHAIQIGAIIGLGVVLGDHANSFIKRCSGLVSGAPSITDRFDWALGGGIAAYLCLPAVTLLHVAALVVIAAPAHVYFNRNSYLRGWRKTEH